MTASLANQLRLLLIQLASAGQTVTYRDLADRAGISPPHRIHRLTLALEDLINEDQIERRPLIAALVVSKVTGGIPAPGFFQLCNTLGLYNGPDSGPHAALFHAEQLARVLAYWGAGPPVISSKGSP